LKNNGQRDENCMPASGGDSHPDYGGIRAKNFGTMDQTQSKETI
jgi:hypothetical protein